MVFGKLIRTLAPIAALAFAATLGACHGSVFIDGDEGKKLSELDMSGAAPTKLVLAGPDTIKLSEGSKLEITVEGDPKGAEQVRFAIKNGTLSVLRPNNWKDGQPVIVKVTMPAPTEVTVAGSGTIEAAALGKDPKVTIAGSGDLKAGTISGDSFNLSVAGSGNVSGAGSVKDLDMTIAGSGSADLSALRTDHAKVTVAGSGNASFSSDGSVEATIMGSGQVTVRGRATCTVTTMGSGKLVCESGEAKKDG